MEAPLHSTGAPGDELVMKLMRICVEMPTRIVGPALVACAVLALTIPVSAQNAGQAGGSPAETVGKHGESEIPTSIPANSMARISKTSPGTLTSACRPQSSQIPPKPPSASTTNSPPMDGTC